MWEVIDGRPLYADLQSTREVLQATTMGRRPELDGSDWRNEKLRSLVESCWAARPTERPSFKEIFTQLTEILLQLSA